MKVLAGLNTLQIVYIAIASTVVALIIFLAIFIPIHKKRVKTKYNEIYYKKIYKIAMQGDYFLINNFKFSLDDSQVAKIDHILFAEKYIYIINDFYYPGNLMGKEDDKSFILINEKGKKFYTDNPLINSQRIINSLSLLTGIDKTMFIGLILVNKNCSCNIKFTTKTLYLVKYSLARKLIKSIESRDIGTINQDQLGQAVAAINKLNRRKIKSED